MKNKQIYLFLAWIFLLASYFATDKFAFIGLFVTASLLAFWSAKEKS